MSRADHQVRTGPVSGHQQCWHEHTDLRVHADGAEHEWAAVVCCRCGLHLEARQPRGGREMLALLRWWLIGELVRFAEDRRWRRLARWARERERDWGPWLQ